jgi:4-amino-4-deoxy-L-arabinose transferase-like glycosyltransferase
MDRFTRGWRGPLLAACVALLSALPGALRLPITDRSEARLAESTAQMLEDRDLIATAIDDQASDHRPLGVHWLQAAGVALMSDAEARQPWAFRLPALAAGMSAAAACAWGGAALFGSGAGFAAGAMLGAGLLVSSAAMVDAPGALLCAGITLAMAALARLRLAADWKVKAGRRTRVLLWLGLTASVIAGGPIGPMVVAAATAALWLVERRAAWLAGIGWSWGLILLAALAGPSVIAGAVNGQQGAPILWPQLGASARAPGFQLLIAAVMLFPFALMLPAGLAAAVGGARTTPVRIALCWLVPAWLVLEFARGRPPDGGLVFYGAAAWLMALGAREGAGPVAARVGATAQVLAAALLVAVMIYVAQRFGGASALGWAAAASLLGALAALGGAGLLLRGKAGQALAVAGVLGVLAHGVAMAGLAPRLDTLWTAKRAAAALAQAGLDPRAGSLPGPVAVSGFGEPSLTFVLGGQTESVTAKEAAEAVQAGRPAIVEVRQEDAFLAALPSKAAARKAAEVEGYDYANGSAVTLEIYGPAPR